MTWTKLDDRFPDHPKILAAGPIAEVLHIHGMIYSNKHLTDGFIPANAVKQLLHVPERRPVQRLIELGIWAAVEGGYQIHDFLDYQPTKAEVEALRENRARLGRLGGLAKARAIAKEKSSKPLADPSRPVGSLEPRLGGNTPSVENAVKKPLTNGKAQGERLRAIAAEKGILQ